MVSSSVTAREFSRSPLRVMFVATILPVAGEEVLLAEMVRRMYRRRFASQISCLRSKGELGEQLAQEVLVAGYEDLLERLYAAKHKKTRLHA